MDQLTSRSNIFPHMKNGGLHTLKKYGNIDNDPVPLFENAPIGSSYAFELLTITEVAQLLKISVSGVRRLQYTRQIPFLKVGGSIRFSKNDMVAFLEKQRINPIG